MDIWGLSIRIEWLVLGIQWQCLMINDMVAEFGDSVNKCGDMGGLSLRKYGGKVGGNTVAKFGLILLMKISK